MAFCNNCGTELPDGAKFCHVCGKPVNMDNNEHTQRKQVFEGNVHKCPNCGESVASFQRNCPTCGFEFREVQSSKAIKDFVAKLARIEASRNEGKKLFGLFGGKTNLEIANQKIDVIQNYPVPNAKEDMVEFMILASSNAKSSLDIDGERVSSAWMSKAKQVYEKANNSYGNDNDTKRISQLYEKCYKEVKKETRKRKMKEAMPFVLTFGSLPAICIIVYLIVCIHNGINDPREEERLGSMVSIVEEAIDSNDYKFALLNAESMEYNGSNKERKKWWDIQRETLVDRIILEAEQEGIHLEPSPTPTIEPTTTPTIQPT